ncbi:MULTISPECIES: methyltransferase domain-containing protein [unclassified Streptomyces]|uniref:class I SAM-dependent DNA methyltransferase n=1 Tax=unclassified Streptomyces TaxID=2593676 RepID=UPI002DDB7779|nr:MULTISPECIES: methyltransferase domain-containing protein [unclassified Streptomyces]WSB77002.1 class I SAM-dependent methyltransferase [Streptomyces sp. NBC_01775]WSS14727.1 class I SAM-dependent methyltransferase [Streptomyces sp. NBC_01186]WSS43555.1 class I SAM-dependent methyltransferase [Streptomyces sp. NBC_01187]
MSSSAGYGEGGTSGACGAYAGFDRSTIDRSGQSEAFDAIGDRYDEAFPHKEGQVAAAAWLGGQLSAGSRVLDVGCGTGLPTARQLTDDGHRVVGIDLSPAMLKLCRDNVPEGECHRLDLADLESAGLGPFDGAVAFFSLLMLPRTEIPCALKMLHGQIRGEGPLVLGMVEADVNDFSIPFLGNTIRVSGYLRDDLRRVVQDAGFEVVGEDAYAYAPASTDVPPEIQLFLQCRRRPSTTST